MPLKYMLLLLTIITCSTANFASAREMPMKPSGGFPYLWPGLGTNGSLVGCLNALSEIRSCSNEIVIFFEKGTTDIGPDCCQAITMITHDCWPAMLIALGFTPDQTNILRGYCDASSGPAPGPSA